MAVELKRRRFTVREYHQMAEAGILGEDDRVELIDGEIVEMTPMGRRHAECVDRLNELFVQMFRDSARVRVQSPITLGRRSEPQPDLALLQRKPGFYASGHPTARDVFLVVEVSDSSVEPDRREKVPFYARNAVPEVWLVDLKQATVTVYQDPIPGGYRIARVFRRGEQVAPAAFPDRSIAIAEILVE